MIYILLLLLFSAFLIILIQCARSRSLKRELESFQIQMEEMTAHKDLTYVTCESEDRNVIALASAINDVITAYQNLEIIYRRKNRETLRIMTNISHDLRTPLTILFGYIEMLDQHISKEQVSEDTKALSRKLISKTQTANRMISHLLDMSRINSGDYPIRMQKVKINELCHKVLLDYYDSLDQLGFRVDAGSVNHEIVLFLDKDSAVRILRNLIENVMAHATDGKYIGLHIIETVENVEVHVVDHGKGVPEHAKTNIFKRGVLLPEDENSGKSHGLGLSIAWNLAQMMHGELYLADTGTVGSDFCWSIKK